MIVDVERLINKLYNLFMQELLEHNIGYNFNIKRLNYMMDLIQVIDYLQNNKLSKREIQKIINLYA